MSQPSPRVAAKPEGDAGEVIFATASGESTCRVPSRPPLRIMRQ